MAGSRQERCFAVSVTATRSACFWCAPKFCRLDDSKEGFARSIQFAQRLHCHKLYSNCSCKCRPACELFAVDLAYAGTAGGGLITDASRALFNLLCTHRMKLCEDCVRVTGPRSANVRLKALQGEVAGYAIDVQWPADYRGPVRVNLESARYAARCASLNRRQLRDLPLLWRCLFTVSIARTWQLLLGRQLVHAPSCCACRSRRAEVKTSLRCRCLQGRRDVCVCRRGRILRARQ